MWFINPGSILFPVDPPKKKGGLWRRCYIDTWIYHPGCKCMQLLQWGEPVNSGSPNTHNQQGKTRYPISGVVDKTLLIPSDGALPCSRILNNKTSTTGLSDFFSLPKELVAELDILRPGNFREILSVSVFGDETRSRLVQGTTADPATVEPKNTTLRRRTRSNRWKGNLVEIQWVNCLDPSINPPPTHPGCNRPSPIDDIITFFG